MDVLDGYNISDFATFDHEDIDKPQQLPTIPVDEVLSKADEKVSSNERKTVTFEDEVPQKPTESIIIPSQPITSNEPSKDLQKTPCTSIVFADYGFYLFMVILAYFIYKQYYY